MFKILTKLLSFRLSRDEILGFESKHFLLGLIGTWLVGMGRYWDDPGAELLQHLGLGSVIYIFALALFIWLIILPLKVDEWRYFTVLTFISLTSFPAIFYAIPVERFVSMEAANSMNAWFLGIVALWRLALLFYFLRIFTDLSKGNIVAVALLPMCLIITTLTYLNLHRVVFNIMSGIRNESAHDSAYVVLNILTIFSMLAVLPLLALYLVSIYKRRFKKNRK